MKDISNEVQTWLDDIEAARKREKDFREKGKEIVETYEGENPDEIPFNILFSNTETLKPALYSNDPRPSVRPRHKNKQLLPIYRYAGTAAQRMLSYLIDSNLDDYDSFSDVMVDTVQDALLPGRGDISIKYSAEGQPGGEDFIENLNIEINKWDRVYYGYSIKWEDVPWKAYELFIDKDQAKELFGSKANKLNYTEGQESDEEEVPKDGEKHTGSLETAHIYQIWDRTDKKIKYISPTFKDIIKTDKDPLNFRHFFNSPKPLQFLNKTNNLVPTALYTIYENQAKELNELTRRIKMVTKAIKVRGVYNGQYSDAFEQIMDGEDNSLSPTDESSMLADGGLKDQIWLMPIAELVATLQQLMIAREQVKQVIYEITSISDIVRGQSKASETLGAQKIKEVWGTMRLKDMQKRVQKFVRQTLRMMLDVACDKFSDESWIKMTGLPYLTEEQFQQASKVKQQAEQMAMMAKQQGQQVPDEPPPEVKKAMEALKQPRWEDIFKILRNDAARAFAVDIETNSTLDTEATEDQKQISDFMNSMGQFNNAMAPMVKEGILPFEAYKSMLLAVCQRFRFGDDVENEIRQMKAPKQQVDPKMQKQIQEKQKEIQKKAEELKKQEESIKKNAEKEADNLEKKAYDLEREKQAFDQAKALFEQKMKFDEQMAAMNRESDGKEAQTLLQNMIKDHKREVQSMMDKAQAKMSDNLTKSKETEKESKIEINNKIPVPKGQVVKLNRDKGQLSGAETEYIYDETED